MDRVPGGQQNHRARAVIWDESEIPNGVTLTLIGIGPATLANPGCVVGADWEQRLAMNGVELR
jgi:hypothetical protein